MQEPPQGETWKYICPFFACQQLFYKLANLLQHLSTVNHTLLHGTGPRYNLCDSLSLADDESRSRPLQTIEATYLIAGIQASSMYVSNTNYIEAPAERGLHTQPAFWSAATHLPDGASHKSTEILTSTLPPSVPCSPADVYSEASDRTVSRSGTPANTVASSNRNVHAASQFVSLTASF